MSLVEKLRFLRDKHMRLCDNSKKINDYLLHAASKCTNRAVLENLYSLGIESRENGCLTGIKIFEDHYHDDLLRFKGLDKLTLAYKEDLKKAGDPLASMTSKYAFITIGWNEQTVTVPKMLAASLNILNLKYFGSAFMVLEKHRENGLHHHTHFLVEFEELFPLSKILGWIFQTKGVKEICLNKNFIDYLGSANKKKTFQSYEMYHDYIHGIKKQDKLQYVDLDDIWRTENQIEKIYVKK